MIIRGWRLAQHFQDIYSIREHRNIENWGGKTICKLQYQYSGIVALIKKSNSRKSVSTVVRFAIVIIVGMLITEWRRLERRKIVTLKTSWRHVLETSWRHVLKMPWRHILKTSWIHYGGKQNTYWRYLYLTKLNVQLANLYFTNLFLTILRRIQNALIRAQYFHYSSYFGTQAASLFRELKSLMTGFVLWNQLNSNLRLQKKWDNKNECLSNILHKHI